MKTEHPVWTVSFAAFFAVILTLAISGCEQKEKVLDIETPAGGVEVEKSENGDIEIEVQKSDGESKEIELKTNGDPSD